jgi:hypothetical protein
MKILAFLAILSILSPLWAQQKFPANTVDCDPHVVNGKEVSHCEIDDGPPKQGPPNLEYNGAMPTADLLLRVNGGLVAEVPICDDWVKFGHTARRVSDLFPEECRTVVSATTTTAAPMLPPLECAGYRGGSVAADIMSNCHIERYFNNSGVSWAPVYDGWNQAPDLRIVCGTKAEKKP